MTKAYDVMTRSIASVTPQTPVAQVASLMRDLNIGDVLVLENNNLRGIVTDRDLTINVLTNGAKSDAPVERYMSTEVVTGAPDWSLEQVAEVMGKHQIRRLPIVENDNVIGIVSLGDVALHTNKRETVAKSLKNISEVSRSAFTEANPLTKLLAIAVPVALGAAVLLFANSKSGRRVRNQIETSDFAEQARGFMNDTAHALQDPKTRQAALAAIVATGLPEKTRQAIQDGVRTLQDNRTRQAALDAIADLELPEKTRNLLQEGVHTLENARTQKAALHALESTGLPDRTRQVIQDGIRTFQDTQSRAGNVTHERVMQFADDARKQAQHLPDQVTRRFQKQKPKRFIFA
jgi:CBS domain-containing protein/predicted peroxiredoxin